MYLTSSAKLKSSCTLSQKKWKKNSFKSSLYIVSIHSHDQIDILMCLYLGKSAYNLISTLLTINNMVLHNTDLSYYINVVRNIFQLNFLISAAQFIIFFIWTMHLHTASVLYLIFHSMNRLMKRKLFWNKERNEKPLVVYYSKHIHLNSFIHVFDRVKSRFDRSILTEEELVISSMNVFNRHMYKRSCWYIWQLSHFNYGWKVSNSQFIWIIIKIFLIPKTSFFYILI